MHPVLLAALISISQGPAVPLPPLPWPLPDFPVVATVDDPTVSLPEMEHSADYSTQLASTETLISTWSEPVTTLSTQLESLLGLLPDTSAGGDFETGFTDTGNAYDFIDSMGSNLAILFQYARSLASITHFYMGVIVTTVIALVGWIFILQIASQVVSFADMVFTVAKTIWDAFWNVIPG